MMDTSKSQISAYRRRGLIPERLLTVSAEALSTCRLKWSRRAGTATGWIFTRLELCFTSWWQDCLLFIPETRRKLEMRSSTNNSPSPITSPSRPKSRVYSMAFLTRIQSWDWAAWKASRKFCSIRGSVESTQKRSYQKNWCHPMFPLTRNSISIKTSLVMMSRSSLRLWCTSISSLPQWKDSSTAISNLPIKIALERKWRIFTKNTKTTKKKLWEAAHQQNLWPKVHQNPH